MAMVGKRVLADHADDAEQNAKRKLYELINLSCLLLFLLSLWQSLGLAEWPFPFFSRSAAWIVLLLNMF